MSGSRTFKLQIILNVSNIPRCLVLKSKLHHLFPLQDEAFVDDSVIVVVSKKPVIEGAFVLDHFQKPGQAILPVMGAELRDDTGGSGMREDTVHFPIGFSEAAERRLIF